MKIAQTIGRFFKSMIPSRIYEAMIWSGWVGPQTRTKSQLIEQAFNRNPAFYSAARIVAQTVASIPVFVEYKKDGKTHQTIEHPLLYALDRNQSIEEFIEEFTLYLIVTGDAYSQTVFSEYESSNSKNRPLGFIVLPSQHISPVLGNRYRPVLKYQYHEYKKVDLATTEVVHVKLPNLSNKFAEGMSPGVPLSEMIDLQNHAVTWNKNIAVSGGVPPLIAKTEQGTTREQAKELQSRYAEQSGSQNSHLLKVLSHNVEVQNLATSPNEAEWQNAVLQSMRFIFMAFGVSSSLMNDAANKTYNNVKDSRKALYTDAAIPIAQKIWKAFSRELKQFYSDNPRIKINTNDIDALQEEGETKARRLDRLVSGGILTPNEARQELGRPMSDDPNANRLMNAKIQNRLQEPDEPVTSLEEEIDIPQNGT